MRILLDTCAMLWLADETSVATPIKPELRGRLLSGETKLFVSSISIWEITNKVNIGKLSIPDAPERWTKRALNMLDATELQFSAHDAFALSKIPLIHRDPFDRMLICQAIQNGLSICTPDPHITQYPISITWNSF